MDPSLYYTLREATTIGDDNQEREGIKMAVQTIGIDLATHVFQLHGVDAHGRVVLRKKLSRTNL
jgi:transposase